MRIVCAPDSLKGVLGAEKAAEVLARGVRRVAGVEAIELPLADGGEGTAAVLACARGGRWHQARVEDALGRPVDARWLLLPDGVAVVESAEAIGLARIPAVERDPLAASSAGLGQLIDAALDGGARALLVTLGGSATVDGGAGLRAVLAGRGLRGVSVQVACDVRNPLLGPRGAARVFGPQKGASPEAVEELEQRLAAMPELAPYAALAGAGAAGGLGAALAALGAELVPGAELVLQAVAFEESIRGASLVITGEGQVDATSAEGKLPAAVSRACRSAGVPCVVFGGRITRDARRLHEQGATAIVPLSGRRSRAAADLTALGETLARLVVALGEAADASGDTGRH